MLTLHYRQHTLVPQIDLVAKVTHVALAFMRSDAFNSDETPDSWPIFMTVGETRSKFEPGTKVMVAIGGWGDTHGFSAAAQTDSSRTRFARNVAAMVEATGADGVDIDWEYPGWVPSRILPVVPAHGFRGDVC